MTTSTATRWTVITVTLFFPFIYLIELHSPVFFAPFTEEALARHIPLVIVLYFYHDHINPFTVGIAAGMTFGVLEMITKVCYLGYFSPLMLIPVFTVHIPDAVMQSAVINFSYNHKTYSLIPVIYVICVLWHWLWNANLYVV